MPNAYDRLGTHYLEFEQTGVYQTSAVKTVPMIRHLFGMIVV